jgi:hypothetical protein
VGGGLRIAILAVGAAMPAVALASNGTHPRTPVLWDATEPCVTVHDRSQGATLHLPYAIPAEDLVITSDEVEDSRRHEFIAFCRSHDPQHFLPTWITDADVQAAVAKSLITADTVEPDDVLEHAPPWSDCWSRITADDDRRPIDFAHADAGVDWDTTGLPIGGYTVQGYAWEPPFNVWWPRPAPVKLHDGDPDAAGPVAAFATGPLELYRNETVTVIGGVDAMAGTTFEVSWALTVAGEAETVWTPIAGTHAIEGESFAFDFTPPEPLWGNSGMLQAVFTDPQARSYTAYHGGLVAVLPADDPGACDTGGGFIGTPCDDSGGETEKPLVCAVTRPPDGGSSSSGAPEQHDSGGCGCSNQAASSWLLLIGVLLLPALRGSGRARD